MNTLNLVKILGELGGRFPKSKLPDIMYYLSNMLRDGRVILIKENGINYAVAFVSLGSDYNEYYKKGTWDYRKHDVTGRVLYVELIVCRQWNKHLRKLFQNELLSWFPQIEEAHWHRWASWGDRHITWRRKIHV